MRGLASGHAFSSRDDQQRLARAVEVVKGGAEAAAPAAATLRAE